MDGKTIEVKNAATVFGDFSYTVKSGKDNVTFSLAADFRKPPESIELNVPYPVVWCEVDGRKVEVSEKGVVAVPPATKKVVFEIARG